MNKPAFRHAFPAILAIGFLFSLLLSAGCIFAADDPNAPPQFTSTDVLNETLDTFSIVLEEKTARAAGRLADLAGLIEANSGSEKTQQFVRSFYVDNIKLAGVCWYDARDTSVCIAPYSNETAFNPAGLLPLINQSLRVPQLIGPLETAYRGTLYAFAMPVYHHGEYSGYAASFFDPADFVTDAAVEMNTLNGCGVQIFTPDGEIFYAPLASDIGRNIRGFPEERPGLTEYLEMLNNTTGLTGLFKAFSPVYHLPVYKQAAWKTISLLGEEYCVSVNYCQETPKLAKDYKPDFPEMETYVRCVFINASTSGMDRAIAALNDKNGSFAYSGYSVFAYDTSGHLLADLRSPYQVGQNCMNQRASYGLYSVQEMCRAAVTSDGGYYEYLAPVSEDPASDEGILTCAYLIRVGSEWFIGSALPVSGTRTAVDIRERQALADTMQTALRMYAESGETALPMYMNRTETPLEGNTHEIFVLDYNGTVLSSYEEPERVGSNILSLSYASNRLSVTKMLIRHAKYGGGYASIAVDEPGTGMSRLSFAYIEPLNDTAFIGVSVPVQTYVPERKTGIKGLAEQ